MCTMYVRRQSAYHTKLFNLWLIFLFSHAPHPLLSSFLLILCSERQKQQTAAIHVLRIKRLSVSNCTINWMKYTETQPPNASFLVIQWPPPLLVLMVPLLLLLRPHWIKVRKFYVISLLIHSQLQFHFLFGTFFHPRRLFWNANAAAPLCGALFCTRSLFICVCVCVYVLFLCSLFLDWTNTVAKNQMFFCCFVLTYGSSDHCVL